jgi:hypothetical protein
MHAFLEGIVKLVVRLSVDPLPDGDKVDLDHLVDRLFGKLQLTTTRDFLRTNFTHGFTNLTMITADEWAGMTYTLLILLRTECGSKIFSARLNPTKDNRLQLPKITNEAPISMPSLVGDAETLDDIRNSVEKTTEWIEEINMEHNVNAADYNSVNDDEDDNQDVGGPRSPEQVDTTCDQNSILSEVDLCELLETILCFFQLYRRGYPYTNWDSNGNKQSTFLMQIRIMSGMITTYLPRQVGNNWNLQKLHDLKNAPNDIELYGSPANFDAGPGEHGLKYWAKFLALTCQKRDPITFLFQIGQRLYENACTAKYLSLNKHLIPQKTTSSNRIKSADNVLDDNESNGDENSVITMDDNDDDREISSHDGVGSISSTPKFGVAATTNNNMYDFVGQPNV